MKCEVTKVVDIDGSEVTLVKSDKVKRITLSIRLLKGARVTMPYSAREDKIIEWLYANSERIKIGLQEAYKEEKKKTFFTPDTLYKMKFRNIKFLSKPSGNVSLKKVAVNLVYSIPALPGTENFQKYAEEIYLNRLREEAKEYLPYRFKELSERYNFGERKLVIKDIRSRWGSCSMKRINLSLHIMRLPFILIDLVILHELAHTIVPNHSKNFYEVLDTVCPQRKELAEQMKAFHPGIF